MQCCVHIYLVLNYKSIIRSNLSPQISAISSAVEPESPILDPLEPELLLFVVALLPAPAPI